MDGPKDDREVFARNLHAALSEAASTPPVTPPARMPSFASDPGQLEVLDTKSVLESLSVSAMKNELPGWWPQKVMDPTRFPRS